MITRLLCCELTLQNEYLRQENKILKSKIKKRIVFTDDERQTLVKAALAMGKDLMEKVVTIVKPKTILAWQRKLEKQKWGYERIQGELKSLILPSPKAVLLISYEGMGFPPHPKEKDCHGESFCLEMPQSSYVRICSRRKSGPLKA